jgi:hypothetical protein
MTSVASVASYGPSVCVNTEFGVAFQLIIPDTLANSLIVFVAVQMAFIPIFLYYLYYASFYTR